MVRCLSAEPTSSCGMTPRGSSHRLAMATIQCRCTRGIFARSIVRRSTGRLNALMGGWWCLCVCVYGVSVYTGGLYVSDLDVLMGGLYAYASGFYAYLGDLNLYACVWRGVGVCGCPIITIKIPNYKSPRVRDSCACDHACCAYHLVWHTRSGTVPHRCTLCFAIRSSNRAISPYTRWTHVHASIGLP